MKFIKKQKKNNKGMTYVELLVALSLLMLIVVTFTPMLLSSYSALYDAGELNEKTYSAKTDLEEGLATRDSAYTKLMFGQLEGITQKLEVTLKSITTDLQESFQTLFYGGRGYLRIVSPKVIRDDYSVKEVAFQITGMYIPDNNHIKINAGQESAKVEEVEVEINGIKQKQKAHTVAVKMFLPNFKDGINEETGFSDALRATILSSTMKVEPNSKNKKTTITLKFDGSDVTDSVIKIVVYYKDENGEEQEISGFIQIDAPTLMFVGETTNIETNGEKSGVTPAYYTSSGVDGGNFTIEARPMTADTGEKYPTGTTFNKVEYITNDNTGYFKPYYVIVGNKGVIQRLYLGSKNGVDGYNAISGRTDPLTGFNYKDGTMLKVAYPTVWGGDKSHQFGFSTYGDFGAYYEGMVWYTGSSAQDGTENPAYDVYDNQASYSMYFNGLGMTHKEAMRNARTISYTLTETGYAIRLVGELDGTTWGGFVTSWESAQESISNNEWNTSGTLFAIEPSFFGTKKHTDARPLRVNDPCNVRDSMYGMLRLKNYCSTNLNDLLHIWGGDGEKEQHKKLADNEETHDIDITAAVFNPQLGEMLYLGTANAFGLIQQVDASTSNRDANKQYEFWMDESKNIKREALTGYVIMGDAVSGTQVYKASSHRDGEKNGSETNLNGAVMRSFRNVAGLASDGNYTNTITPVTNATAFFVDRTYPYSSSGSGTGVAFGNGHANSVWNLYMKDFNFHLGYSSNRTNVYSDIVYGTDKAEHTKSYERFFFLSHYGDKNGPPGKYSNDANYWVKTAQSDASMKNSMHNDMYNVWFPGEFYSLIASATKDGITVAVGYTAAGSSFQRVREATNNTSTSLGGLFNDGVMAIMTPESPNFQNILYYKDYEKFDSSSITDGSSTPYLRYGTKTTNGADGDKTTPQTYQEVYGSYGTHARESIHFLCVDIATHSTTEKVNINVDGTQTEVEREKEKTYYAVYGDDRGRAFVSKIATTKNASTGSSASSTTVVDGIRDLYSTQNKTFYPTPADKDFGYMNEIYVTTSGDKKERLDTYFAEINVITAYEDVVIISGIPRDTQTGTFIVIGQINGADSTVSGWKLVKISNDSTYDVEDMLVMDGVVYFVGQYTGADRTDKANRGFVAYMMFDEIETALKSTQPSNNWGVNATSGGIIKTNNALYGIAGRGQNTGMEAE